MNSSQSTYGPGAKFGLQVVQPINRTTCGEIFVVLNFQPRKHTINACLNAWKTKATVAPDPSLIQANRQEPRLRSRK